MKICYICTVEPSDISRWFSRLCSSAEAICLMFPSLYCGHLRILPQGLVNKSAESSEGGVKRWKLIVFLLGIQCGRPVSAR